MFSEVLNSLGKITEKLIATGAPHGIAKMPELRQQNSELEGILLKEKTEFQVRLP